MRGKAMRWNQIKSSKAIMERGAAPLCLILLVMALVCGQKAEAQANGGVASIVTEEIFNQIVAPNSSSCEGSGFYTTYSTFIDVANNFSGFGTSSSDDVNRREIAAFFGNTAHETIGFCYINEINPGSDYCDTSNTTYPCVSGKKYYGRGPIQLSWNFNYGPAGQYFNFDGLGDPDTVARDAKVSYGTAVWYWMVQSSCHKDITSGQGFGATINDINGALECNGGNSNAVQSRVNYYKKFCQLLGVDPGSNLTC